MRVVLWLEGEALKILDNLLLHEQNSWAEIEGALHWHFGKHVPREEACEELAGQQAWQVHGRHLPLHMPQLPKFHHGG